MAASASARPPPGQRLRVTVVAACPFPSRRGTPARVLGQAASLARQGADVQVVAYHLREFAPPAGLPVRRTPRIPTYRRLEAGPSLQKLTLVDALLLATTFAAVRRRRPHLLHGHHVEGALVALAVGRLAGIPVVFDVHTSLREELPTYAFPLPAGFWRRVGSGFDRFTARACRHVVTTTEGLRREILSANAGVLAPNSVTAIPGGIDPLALPSAILSRDPGARRHARRLVYAGGLSGFQRIDLLAKAFELVRQELPDVRLVVLSEDPPETFERVWPRGVGTGAVHRVRPRSLDDLFAQLAEADVAVSPRTTSAGLPQKLLNYMRVGLPVVTGAAEPVRHGETAWVAQADDPQSFAAGILALLRSPELRRRLGGAARDEVERRFGWEGAARQLLAVYERVLRERGSWRG